MITTSRSAVRGLDIFHAAMIEIMEEDGLVKITEGEAETDPLSGGTGEIRDENTRKARRGS